MQTAYDILSFISGIGAFLFGIKVMGESINRAAGPKLTKNLNKLTNNRFKGLGFGFSFTAVMQSSTATIALLVGFVGAGILSFTQTIAVVFGANIGTVITEFLVAFETGFSMFKLSYIFAAMAGIGSMVFVLAKKERTKDIAKIFIGIGLMFIGIKLIQDAAGKLGKAEWFINTIIKLKNPILLILVGFDFTAIVQSSLGSIVILMGIAVAVPEVTLYQCIFYVFGANIGTTINSFLASIGTPQGKRVAFAHLFFNLFGTLFFSILLIASRYDTVIVKMTSSVPLQIVLSNLFFKLGTALILLPFIKPIDKMIKKLVKDSKAHKYLSEFIIDDTILAIPSLALHKVHELNVLMIEHMGQMLDMAIDGLRENSTDGINKMVAKRDYLYAANMKINDQMARIISLQTAGLEGKITNQIRIVNEFNSIIKHMYIFYENVTAFVDQKYDRKLIENVEIFYQKVTYIIEIGKAMLKNDDDTQTLSDSTIEIIELEESLSIENARAKKEQLTNLKKGQITRAHSIYLNMLAELEDIGGKLSGICVRAK